MIDAGDISLVLIPENLGMEWEGWERGYLTMVAVITSLYPCLFTE